MKWHKFNRKEYDQKYIDDEIKCKEQCGDRWKEFIIYHRHKPSQHKLTNASNQVWKPFYKWFFDRDPDVVEFDFDLFMVDLIKVLPALKVAFNVVYGNEQKSRTSYLSYKDRITKSHPKHHPLVYGNTYDYDNYQNELCYINSKWCCEHRIIFLFGLIEKYKKGNLPDWR